MNRPRFEQEEDPEVRIKRFFKKIFLLGGGGLLLLILFFSTVYIVDAGERAVIVTLGKASDVSINPGVHFKAPFIQKAIIYDVRTQKYEADASAASSDLQVVSTKIATNYHLAPESVSRLYQEIGTDYQGRLIQPIEQEVVKATTARFTAEELITKRELVRGEILNLFKEKLALRYIIVEDVSITNFDFSQNFNEAIEAKVTAEQNALAAKNKLAQIEYEAQQRIAAARGEAEAIKIQSQAIQAQGGKEYVQLQAITKWNGQLPIVVGSGSIPFVNIPSYNMTN